MNIKTIIFRILSILLGLVFIFSAYVKLFPIEILEIAIVETGPDLYPLNLVRF